MSKTEPTTDAAIIGAQIDIVEAAAGGWHVYPKGTSPRDFPWFGMIVQHQSGYVAFARGPIVDIPLGPFNDLEAAATAAFRVWRMSL